MLEFSHLDSACFQVFLDSLAQTYPHDRHLIQLDRAPAHTAHTLRIPDTIRLVFQPPYCPELNPIERVWQELRRFWAWTPIHSLNDLQQTITQWIEQLSPHQVQSLTQWDWLMNAISVAGI